LSDADGALNAGSGAVNEAGGAFRRAPLRIGTRGSLLALAQAHAVAAAIGGGTEIVEVTTAGDVDRTRGDKSRWTGALEAALLAEEIDVAVHSAKDVPGELADGTEIAATPRRAQPWDVLVGEASLERVREGARVGTSALRRRAQLLAARPDLIVAELRGNVDTRLRKHAAGEVDVLVLAAAGLDRLGRRCVAGGALRGEVFVPAAGQGVIAVQARAGSPAADAAAAVSHARTMACLKAERAVVREMSASCHAPVGVHAEVVANRLRLRGFAGLPDGSKWVVDEIVWGGDEIVRGGHESVRGSHESVRGSHETVRASHETVRASRETVRGGHKTVRRSHETVRGSHETVRGGHETVRRSDGTVPEGDDEVACPGAAPEEAGRELARRMRLAGADDLLHEAEAMTA
jgi:hydroxymethylbilane synthase